MLTRISSKTEIEIQLDAQRQPTIYVVEQNKKERERILCRESNQGPLGLESCTKQLHYVGHVKDNGNLLIIIASRAFGSFRILFGWAQGRRFVVS